MSEFPFDIVLFDLDGTLVDSNLDLCPAINHALAMQGRPPIPLQQARTMIGGGVVLLLKRALDATGGSVSEDRLAELTHGLLEYYWAHIADNTVPYPGVLGALDSLAAKGCKLAVTTNKLEKPARQLLEALDMAGRFSAVYGGDTLGPNRGKPKGDMLVAAIAECGGGRAVLVGDSTYDVRAARNAGIPVVTYRYGYHDVPVADLEGDAMIDHFDDLVTTLKSL
jgi:phosphoglycolate phosphatase